MAAPHDSRRSGDVLRYGIAEASNITEPKPSSTASSTSLIGGVIEMNDHGDGCPAG